MHPSNPLSRGTGVASQAAKASQGGDTHQYLTFNVGREMFAVGILNVKEIIEYDNLTAIPMMPNFIRGVINLRGAVVPVIDLGARFSGSVSSVQRRTCIVIVEITQDDEKHDLGVMVDAVVEVLPLAHDVLRLLRIVPDRRVFRFGVQLRQPPERIVPVKDASSAARPTASCRRRATKPLRA